MNRCRKYKSDKRIKKILENHFEEFRKLKWNRVRKEMREHILDIVKRTLNCGNIENGYIKHKCLECNEEYIHGFTCKTSFSFSIYFISDVSDILKVLQVSLNV